MSDASSIDPNNNDNNDGMLGGESASAPGQGLAPTHPSLSDPSAGMSTAATDPPTSGGIKGLFSWIFRKRERANQAEATITPSPSAVSGSTTIAAHSHTNNTHPSISSNTHTHIANPIITALEQSEHQNHEMNENHQIHEDNDDPIDALPLPELLRGQSQGKVNPLSFPEKDK